MGKKLNLTNNLEVERREWHVSRRRCLSGEIWATSVFITISKNKHMVVKSYPYAAGFFFSQTLIKALAFPPHCFSLQTLHRCCMPWKVVPCVCVRPWSNALFLSGVYQLAASVDLNYTDTVHLSDLHSCCHLNICVLCDTEKCPRIQVSYSVVRHVKLSWKCMQISIYHLSLFR